MKSRVSYLIAAAAFTIIGAGAAPAMASQDIPWTWNSNDHDAKANFVAYGEVYHGWEHAGDTYMDWSGPSGSGRWYIPGTDVTRTLNFDWPENKIVTLKVCQNKTAFPDDCSSTKTGVS